MFLEVNEAQKRGLKIPSKIMDFLWNCKSSSSSEKIVIVLVCLFVCLFVYVFISVLLYLTLMWLTSFLDESRRGLDAQSGK